MPDQGTSGCPAPEPPGPDSEAVLIRGDGAAPPQRPDGEGERVVYAETFPL